MSYVFYESGLAINVMYDVADAKKRAGRVLETFANESDPFVDGQHGNGHRVETELRVGSDNGVVNAPLILVVFNARTVIVQRKRVENEHASIGRATCGDGERGVNGVRGEIASDCLALPELVLALV